VRVLNHPCSECSGGPWPAHVPGEASSSCSTIRLGISRVAGSWLLCWDTFPLAWGTCMVQGLVNELTSALRRGSLLHHRTARRSRLCHEQVWRSYQMDSLSQYHAPGTSDHMSEDPAGVSHAACWLGAMAP
jgi:hypothetical protein